MLELIDGRGRVGPVPIPRPRVVGGHAEAAQTARAIVDDVRARGDAALVEHTVRLDGGSLSGDLLRVDPGEIEAALRLVHPELVEALRLMWVRVEETAAQQLPYEWSAPRGAGTIGELVRPLRSVGIYAPGGRATYPSSIVMAAAPARAAGVARVAVATPPRPSGEVPDATLAACAIAGIDEVYRIGGAQAIAAFAYGTETVRPVDKIVGPGNVYVTEAKRYVAGDVGTDAEAGPTELVVVADATADARVVAADLVAQAEHGPHGAHVLITWTKELVDETLAALELEVLRHERAEDVENALMEGGSAVLVDGPDHALETANAFAPEHLQLTFEGARARLADVDNAGAVFVGEWSPVAAGDYLAGTNHVLPSGGSARWRSGLGAHEFVRRIYVCDLDRTALEEMEPQIAVLARAEGLRAHERTVEVRLEQTPPA